MLSLLILGIVIFIILKLKNLKLFRGHLFSNAVKVMLLISDVWYFVPIKLHRTGSMHLFKITGTLTPENVKLKTNILLEIIKLDWKEVSMTLNGNKINLTSSVTIRFKDKFKINVLSKENPCIFILC